jgi:hypothetical protein
MATAQDQFDAQRFVGLLRNAVGNIKSAGVSITALQTSWEVKTAAQRTNILNAAVAQGYDQTELSNWYTQAKAIRDQINTLLGSLSLDSTL